MEASAERYICIQVMRQMFERALVPRFVLGELQPSQGGDGIQGQLHPRLGLPRRVRQSALVSHRARDGRLQEQMLQRALPSFFLQSRYQKIWGSSSRTWFSLT